MKNIYYLFLIILTTLMSACKKSFIDIAPISSASPEIFFNSANDFKIGVNAIYNGLQPNETYGRFYYILMEARSDNTDMVDKNASSGEYSQIDLFGETSTNTAIQNAYLSSYVIISRANLLLDKIQGSNVLSDALKKQYQGEALFLRSLTYFNLVRLWGGIPMPLHSYKSANEADKEPRVGVASVYKQIETDLIASANLLSGITYSKTDLGRVTANAANALLGKVYLTQKKWNDALIALNKVKAELVTDYATLYDLNKTDEAFAKEIIFAVRYKKGISPSVGNNFLNNMTKAPENVPSGDMKQAYETGDLRKAISISAVGFVNKFPDPPSANNDSGNSFPVLRYADVLLMIAEANNELGYAANGIAFDNLNKIRQRAGLGALSSTTLDNQDAFRDAIFKERRVELAFENDRWFDLIRYHKGLSIIQNHLTSLGLAGNLIGSNRLLYGIPAAEINVHNDPINFPQNPGY